MELRLAARPSAMSVCAKIWHWIMQPRPTAPPPAPMTEHIRRDIGLSPAEAERHGLKLPSQSVRHPYL